MKIGILTYYGVHNHGALLQANALKNVLEQLGHDVFFLTFERNYDYSDEGKSGKYEQSVSSIPYYFSFLKDRGIKSVYFNFKKRALLNKFKKENFVFFNDWESFDGDLVIIGSDEVFSVDVGFNPMLYGLGIKVNNVISYAASFGSTKFNDLNDKLLSEKIATGLAGFKSISVRDINSASIVDSLVSKKPEVVCDPVILYGYKTEITNFQPTVNNYLVIYAYDKRMNDPIEVKQIKQYAQDNGLQIISVGYYHDWADKNIISTPYELLGWIRSSKLVITDTFHGSVISIITNTPFVTKLRDNSNKVGFLLEEFGLSNRIISNFSELEKVSKQPIEFNEVNRIIELKRSLSMRFLESNLS